MRFLHESYYIDIDLCRCFIEFPLWRDFTVQKSMFKTSATINSSGLPLWKMFRFVQTDSFYTEYIQYKCSEDHFWFIMDGHVLTVYLIMCKVEIFTEMLLMFTVAWFHLPREDQTQTFKLVCAASVSFRRIVYPKIAMINNDLWLRSFQTCITFFPGTQKKMFRRMFMVLFSIHERIYCNPGVFILQKAA